MINYLRIKITPWIVLVVLFSFSCVKNEQPQYTQISVLMDVTDEHLKNENFVAENLPGFMEMMNLDKQTGGFSGGEIKLSFINEVSDSKSKSIKIESQGMAILIFVLLTKKLP